MESINNNNPQGYGIVHWAVKANLVLLLRLVIDLYSTVYVCDAYLNHQLLLSCRPGRLEVQVEISLPDENGRLQILQIHTNKMKDNSFLSPDVNLQELGMCLVMHKYFNLLHLLLC